MRCFIYTCLVFAFFISANTKAATISICATEQAGANTLASSLEDNNSVYLQVNGTGSSCETLTLPLPDTAIKWGRIISDSLLSNENARVILQGQFSPESVVVSELIIPEPARVNPPQNTPPIETVRTPAAQPVTYRSGWLWQPAWWVDTPEQAWNIATQENLERIFITVLVNEGRVSNAEQLAGFLAQSHARGLSVWAVIGDRRDVIPESLPALISRADAYKNYNSLHPDNESLDGLQLDIEPYLLPGFDLDQDYWRTRYIETIGAVHETLDSALPLDLVMPVWWGNHPQWGEQLFSALNPSQLSVTVMNYRTDIDRLRTEAIPFLTWGEHAGTSIHIALEYGVLGDEMRQHFYPAQQTSGELWRFTIGSHNVLLLLDEVHAGLPGMVWKMAFESEFSASTLTFNGNRELLDNAIQVLAFDWSAWSSFAGIAIHGVESLFEKEMAP